MACWKRAIAATYLLLGVVHNASFTTSPSRLTSDTGKSTSSSSSDSGNQAVTASVTTSTTTNGEFGKNVSKGAINKELGGEINFSTSATKEKTTKETTSQRLDEINQHSSRQTTKQNDNIITSSPADYTTRGKLDSKPKIGDRINTTAKDTTFCYNLDLAVTDLKVNKSDSTMIEIKWKLPICNSITPVKNYSIIISSAREKGEKKEIPARDLKTENYSIGRLNVGKGATFDFQLEPCTNYTIKVKPNYGKQFKSDGYDITRAIAARTLRLPEDKILNYTAHCSPEQLNLSWAFDCELGLKYWRIIVMNDAKYIKEVKIPLSYCRQEANKYAITWSLADGTICPDTHPQVFDKNFCPPFQFSIAPMWEDQEPVAENTEVVTRESLSLAKYPCQPTGIKATEESDKLVIVWQPPINNSRYVCSYNYSLNYGSLSENGSTSKPRLERDLKQCVPYSISVWSVDSAGNNCKNFPPCTIKGETSPPDFEIPRVSFGAKAVNATCLYVTWSLPPEFTFYQCISYRIQLLTPSEENGSVWDTVDSQVKEKMLCHLVPGNVYEVIVHAITSGVQPRGAQQALTVTMPKDLDSATTGLIVAIVLLAICAIAIILYVTRPWFLQCGYGSERRGRSDQQVRTKATILGTLGRRRAHPIKVKDIQAVTARLCSSAGHQMEMEYEDLTIISDARRAPPSIVALRPQNKGKNRYANILPYDHSRVALTLLPDEPFSDYINASYIMGFNGQNEYIAAQGPKDCTIRDFWRMVWEQNVRMIVMATALEERGKPKCDHYWPGKEEPLTFKNFTVRLLDESDFTHYIKRVLQIEWNKETRSVTQMYLKGWPDFGCPEEPEILVNFVEVVRRTIESNNDPDSSPILVHCSAGVGRTGTFIALDWLMQEARVSPKIDVFATVLRMRERRMSMVQSEDQYEFIYKCMSYFANTRLRCTNGTKESNSDGAFLLVDLNETQNGTKE